ncbi:elongation factor G [Aceticella autotrophica]|uniref:Elongation factor G n=1 Tax=Aceticella autotrophica TaxID=2755338 RepID=A0A975GAH6_9THEO|nr:elongation factor G [Aceticella autotrophica]QSZ27191.1 elongation factor G [Aceticella autotrophica]
MKDYKTNDIRNVCFVSHGGAGKTTLSEALLFNTKTIDRMGRIEEGTTVSDYDPEEIERQFSVSTSLIPIEWKNCKINVLDTPGYFDFLGEVLSGLRAADSAVLMVCGTSGVEVGTEKAFSLISKDRIPSLIYINKMDRENADFYKVMEELRDKFGKKIVPLTLPIGSEVSFKGFIDLLTKRAQVYTNNKMETVDIPEDMQDKMLTFRDELIESIVENDEILMEKFLAGEELMTGDLVNVLKAAVKSFDLIPVLCGSSLKNIAVDKLMDTIVDILPSPLELTVSDNNKSFSAFVFKTITDPFVGKLSIFKVMSGSISSDSTVYNATKKMNEKIGQLYILRGKKQIAVQQLGAGDIGAVAKLQATMTGDTLTDGINKKTFESIHFPTPLLALAIEPKAKGDEDKISSGLSRLMEEDRTFKVEKNLETGQMIIYGMGEQHIEVLCKKLMSKFGVECELKDPIIPYRETIKRKAKVEGKHKKQTGGHGQYGHVWIEFEPNQNEDFKFEDKIFGGAVPKQYIPAVEKGLRECLKEGVLAKYPVVNIKATLLDGSYHPVDSSEMAFKMAAAIAFKKGMEQANPVLLEPIMHVEVIIPEEYMGDIIGDLNKRRGHILGMEAKDEFEVVTAEVPQAEMMRYATDLRSITQARGNFTMSFARYEEVPPPIAAKIIEARKKMNNLA